MSQWAADYIAELKASRAVSFRPTGRSMEPRIRSGQLVTVEPLGDAELCVGDVVLCTVERDHYLHLIKRIDPMPKPPPMYLIGNNKGGTNGWIERAGIHGWLVKVSP